MTDFRSFRVEAVVLRHSDWGEADRIVTLFTRELGKLRAIAKGARRMRSRKAGHLEPFTQVRLLLARGRDLMIVTQAETVDAFLDLREDLVQTGYAAYVVELLDRFTYEEEIESSSLFRLITDTLRRINGEADTWLAVRYFEIRLLDLLGFRPHLFHCANCEKEIQPEGQFFAPGAGGVLCPRCGPGLPGAWQISQEALKYVRHFQRSRFRDVQRARPTSDVQQELEALMQAYLQYLLERGLNSPGFIKRAREINR